MILFVVVAVLLGMIGITLLTPESRLVLRQWRVFVPLAAGWAVATLLVLLGVHVAFLGKGPELPLRTGPKAQHVTVLALLLLTLEAFVMAWVTPLLQRVAAGERAGDHLLPCLRQAPRLLPRMLLALLIGQAVPTAAMALFFGWRAGGLEVAVAIVLVLVPLWSVLTSSLVFELLDRRTTVVAAVQRSLRRGTKDGLFWGGLVFLQAAIAGALVVLPEHLSLHANWYGGYPVANHWVEQLRRIAPTGFDLGIATVVAAASAWFVLAIKLRVAGVLQQRANGRILVTVDRQRTGAVQLPASPVGS